MNENITDKFIQELKIEISNLSTTNCNSVIRKSGTEPLLRIMLQHESAIEIDKIFETITRNRPWLQIC
jgi:phosphomannomutase